MKLQYLKCFSDRCDQTQTVYNRPPTFFSYFAVLQICTDGASSDQLPDNVANSRQRKHAVNKSPLMECDDGLQLLHDFYITLR